MGCVEPRAVEVFGDRVLPYLSLFDDDDLDVEAGGSLNFLDGFDGNQTLLDSIKGGNDDRQIWDCSVVSCIRCDFVSRIWVGCHS